MIHKTLGVRVRAALRRCIAGPARASGVAAAVIVGILHVFAARGILILFGFGVLYMVVCGDCPQAFWTAGTGDC